MAVQGQSNLGRSYRSYRFPQRKGGRLSRRPAAGQRLGPLAGGISAFFLAMLAMGGVAEATRTFSKKQILEMYLNQIYYGNQAYGIEAAAKTYFDQPDLMRLTLGQMAMLAGLAQRPSDYDPVQNPDAAKARRTQVLDAMVDSGYIGVS